APVAQPPAPGAAERPRVAPPPGRPRRRLDLGEGPLQGGGEVGGDVAHGGDLDGADGQGRLGHGAAVPRSRREVSQAPPTPRAVPATAAAATRSSSRSTPRTMATTGMK